MNNSVYGKTIRFVDNAKNYKKYVSKPSFLLQIIFRKQFHKIKSVLNLDKPIYAGFSILDLSKLSEYEFLLQIP